MKQIITITDHLSIEMLISQRLNQTTKGYEQQRIKSSSIGQQCETCNS